MTAAAPAPLDTPHRLSAAEVGERLATDVRRGLTGEEAARRLAEHGPNRLEEGEKRPWWRALLEPFSDFLILILVAAAILSAVVGEVGDTIAILAILVINAVLGLVQEARAQRAMLALKRLATPRATVIRDGHPATIGSEDLVPGDLCVLEAGAAVPADLRLVQEASLKTDESALTGESVPIEKDVAPVEGDNVPIGDRRGMAYMGTLVTYGRGLGVVTATGMRTEVGRIAALLESTEGGKTPLQRRLDAFGKKIGVLALAICALIFVIGVLRGQELFEMLLAAVSLAVAAVPEALPAIVTISLAMGAHRMARQNALVRRLPAVESLGSVTVICSDKTGTLTRNRMTAEEVRTPVRDLEVTGHGYALAGDFRHEGTRVTPDDDGLLRRLLRSAALCNDADLRPHREGPEVEAETVGDPTEVAILVAAAKGGLHRRALEDESPRVGEVPFDGARKRMTTIHERPGGAVVAYVKGAPETLVERCPRIASGDGDEEFTEARRQEFVAEATRMAARGLRVLAFAERTLPARPSRPSADDVERDLTFLGLIGLLDPPRADVAEAVATCREAGVRPVVVTGDHPVTARAISERLDVWRPGDEVLAGPDLDAMDDEALREHAPRVSIYARVSPEHKLRIVRALQARGEITAMTGDGVNDAPALGQADIGVAMGLSGTDVAREASQMVLLDDRYATIVGAIREGRRIYDNIRRFVRYILATNSMEIWVMLLTPFFFPEFALPLLPIQILWINLVTDGPPAIALALEPAEPDVMTRPPRPPGESLFARGVGWHILWVGLFITALALLAVWIGEDGHWRTMIFLVVTFSQMAHVLVIRSEIETVWQRGFRSNPWLVGAILLTIVLTLLVVYVPGLQPIFKTEALELDELALCFGLSMLVILAVEIEKALWRRRLQSAQSVSDTIPHNVRNRV